MILKKEKKEHNPIISFSKNSLHWKTAQPAGRQVKWRKNLLFLFVIHGGSIFPAFSTNADLGKHKTYHGLLDFQLEFQNEMSLKNIKAMIFPKEKMYSNPR